VRDDNFSLSNVGEGRMVEKQNYNCWRVELYMQIGTGSNASACLTVYNVAKCHSGDQLVETTNLIKRLPRRRDLSYSFGSHPQPDRKARNV
jgi:hypothetical protein